MPKSRVRKVKAAKPAFSGRMIVKRHTDGIEKFRYFIVNKEDGTQTLTKVPLENYQKWRSVYTDVKEISAKIYDATLQRVAQDQKKSPR